MSTDLATQLQQFRDYLDELIRRGEKDLLPEEALDLWRMDHPEPGQLARDVAAVKAAIADMEAGDRGIDFDEHVRQVREKYGWLDES